MGKGGAQSTTQTVKQDVPDWAKPFYTDILGKSKALSEEEYKPFGGQRIANEAGDLGTSQGMIRGIAGQPIAGFDAAQGTLGGLGALAGTLGQQHPGQFSAAQFQQTGATPFSGFDQTGADPYTNFSEGQVSPFADFSAGAGQEFAFDPTRQFGGAEAQRYMDPYMQTVVGRQQDDAITQFQRQQAGRAAQAVQAGAFGGSRQAVQQGLAEEALGRQLGDIQATGSQRAFEQAQQQFERDRAAGMTTEQQRAAEAARVQGIGVGEQARVQQAQAADLARTQGISVEEAARVQQAQAAEQARTQGIDVNEAARVQAARAAELARTQGIGVDEASRVQAATAAEQARVQGATADEAMRQREFQLQSMGFSADMAREVANLGERARAGDIQAAQLLEAQGLGEMARDQAGLDINYEDFLRQQNFPRQQLGFYSNILRGLPVADAGTQTTQQPYNPMQQALGAGISAVGLYKGMQ